MSTMSLQEGKIHNFPDQVEDSTGRYRGKLIRRAAELDGAYFQD